MVQAGRTRGFDDGDTVLIELVEPQAGRRGREEAPKTLDCRDNLLVPAGDDIGTNSFCLRPQSCHRIMYRPIAQHGIDRDAAPMIDAMSVGKGDEPLRRRAFPLTFKSCPAIEQECPFVMMSGLADSAGSSRRRRPVRREKLPQSAGFGLDQSFLAQRGDPVRHLPPSRIGIQRAPGERRLKQMHMRIGALRQPSVAVLKKTSERMGIVLLEACAQRGGRAVPAVEGPECTMRTGICEQGKGLIIEVEARGTTCPVKIDDGDNSAVGSGEMPLKIRERMPGRLAPGTVPAKPSGLAVRKGLSSNRSGAVRPCQRLAVEIDGFMKTA